MTIRYKLHHVGLLCEDTAESARFYQDVLGHEITARFFAENKYDLTFLGSGSELFIELVGRPFEGGEAAWFAKNGAGIHHIAFEVENVDIAFAELASKGVRVAWEPDDFLFVRHCGVYDDCGTVVEILSEHEPLPRPTSIDQPVEYLLHHFDLFSNDWQRTKQFYAHHFGLRSIFEYIYPHGGAFIYLADSFFEASRRQAMIEIIGPPYEEPREFAFANKFGTGMDHIGYVVQDVPQAYRLAVRRGASEGERPYQDYGTEMCWLQDTDGNDLELMKPLATSELQKAFVSKRPYRPSNHA